VPKRTNPSARTQDNGTLKSAKAVLTGRSKKGWLARLLPFLGPAFIASIAYVDPGNFATNIQGGAQFGYELLWVILGSNLMAMLLQALSAKLGIATGKNLAEHCRARFSRPVVWTMWVLMELVAMATDLAEFLGAAVALNLLFGLPLWIAGLLTAVITFLILGLERYGFRPLEAVITGFLAGLVTGDANDRIMSTRRAALANPMVAALINKAEKKIGKKDTLLQELEKRPSLAKLVSKTAWGL
jgi:manganese transport protein